MRRPEEVWQQSCCERGGTEVIYGRPERERGHWLLICRSQQGCKHPTPDWARSIQSLSKEIHEVRHRPLRRLWWTWQCSSPNIWLSKTWRSENRITGKSCWNRGNPLELVDSVEERSNFCSIKGMPHKGSCKKKSLNDKELKYILGQKHLATEQNPGFRFSKWNVFFSIRRTRGSVGESVAYGSVSFWMYWVRALLWPSNFIVTFDLVPYQSAPLCWKLISNCSFWIWQLFWKIPTLFWH